MAEIHRVGGPVVRVGGLVERFLAADLEAVLEQTEGLFEELRTARLFLTGGTGFFGCWLLETLFWARERLALDTEVVVLTRRPEAFLQKAPHLASHPGLHLLAGDVTSFPFPKGAFTHVIHAATDASAKLIDQQPLAMFDTIVSGTRHVLEFARQAGAERFLLTSSGAVYGKQPTDLLLVPETFPGAPDPMDHRSSYGEAKRTAELLCALYLREFGLATTIARCFAFVGPYLPLDVHYAVGNFMRDAAEGGPIRIAGDGTPMRSYMYAADLAVWLWTVLLRGTSGRPYNVGSDEALSIRQVAETVRAASGNRAEIQVAMEPQPGKAPDRYVPSVERARTELGLTLSVPLDEGIRRTLEWHANQGRGVRL